MREDDWTGICGEPRPLLMCGNDQVLLEVRCRILQRVGYKAESVTNAKEMLARLESDYRYGLCILCHTVPTERRAALRTLAFRKGIPVYQIERPLFPGDLITNNPNTAWSDARHLIATRETVSVNPPYSFQAGTYLIELP